MLSVQQIQPLIHQNLPTSTYHHSKESQVDANGNMIGTSLPADIKSKKAHSGGEHSLDSNTLLLILNTVLKTQHKTTFPSEQCGKQQSKHIDNGNIAKNNSQDTSTTQQSKT